jgi:hypothetical protein
LQKIHNEYKDKGAMVVMVNIDVDRFRVGPFLKKNPPSAIVLFSDSKVEQSYSVQGIPFNLVLDRKGMIRYSKTGFGQEGESQFRSILDALLNEERASASN